MRTAIPANREKVWTAGITDNAPAGGRKLPRHIHLQAEGSYESCVHMNISIQNPWQTPYPTKGVLQNSLDVTPEQEKSP